jgi:hypothetical protein
MRSNILRTNDIDWPHDILNMFSMHVSDHFQLFLMCLRWIALEKIGNVFGFGARSYSPAPSDLECMDKMNFI